MWGDGSDDALVRYMSFCTLSFLGPVALRMTKKSGNAQVVRLPQLQSQPTLEFLTLAMHLRRGDHSASSLSFQILTSFSWCNKETILVANTSNASNAHPEKT